MLTIFRLQNNKWEELNFWDFKEITSLKNLNLKFFNNRWLEIEEREEKLEFNKEQYKISYIDSKFFKTEYYGFILNFSRIYCLMDSIKRKNLKVSPKEFFEEFDKWDYIHNVKFNFEKILSLKTWKTLTKNYNFAHTYTDYYHWSDKEMVFEEIDEKELRLTDSMSELNEWINYKDIEEKEFTNYDKFQKSFYQEFYDQFFKHFNENKFIGLFKEVYGLNYYIKSSINAIGKIIEELFLEQKNGIIRKSLKCLEKISETDYKHTLRHFINVHLFNMWLLKYSDNVFLLENVEQLLNIFGDLFTKRLNENKNFEFLPTQVFFETWKNVWVETFYQKDRIDSEYERVKIKQEISLENYLIENYKK